MQATIKGTTAKTSPLDRGNIREGDPSKQFPRVCVTGKAPKVTTPTFSNRFLALKFKPIGSLAVLNKLGFNAQLKGIKSTIKGLLNDCRAFLSHVPDGTISELSDLLNSTLVDIAKETNSNYTIEKLETEEGDKYLIVFYRECKTYYTWNAPRLAFLTKLEQENKLWFDAALDAIRYLKVAFKMDIASEGSYAIDYLEERLYDEEDFEDAQQREILTELIENYQGGEIYNLFKLIKNDPILELTALEQRIETLPEYPFKQPLLSALKLCKVNKYIGDYDYYPNPDRYEDNEPFQLDCQYSWIYDFDDVTAEIEQEYECICNEYGYEVPHTFFILSYHSALSRQEIIKQINEKVIEDTFPDQFNLVLKNLCETITNYLDNEPA